MTTVREPLRSHLKHKGKFVLVTLMCWAVAAGYYFLTDPPYVSEAKLMVRYLVEPDDRDGTYVPNRLVQIMRSEMDILTSRELAKKVVMEIGAERLAPGSGHKGTESIVAAGLTVKSEEGSALIRVTFRHADAETAQATLTALIKQYFVIHLQMHRSAAHPEKMKEAFLKSAALAGSAGAFDNSTDRAEADRMVPNMVIVQEPTPSVPDEKRRNQVLIAMIAGGPILGLLAVIIVESLARRSLPEASQLRA